MTVEQHARPDSPDRAIGLSSLHQRFDPSAIGRGILVQERDVLGARSDRRTHADVVAFSESEVAAVLDQLHLGKLAANERLAPVT